jgi:glycosyltransferase involved in cell wall biosynthesis
VSVAVAEDGWLVDECERRGLPVAVEEEPTLAAEREPDVAVGLGASGHAWIAPAAVAKGIPACWWLELGLKGRPAEGVALALGAAAIAAPTEAAAAALRARTAETRVVTITPGVELGPIDEHRVAACEIRGRLAPDERLLVMVARLDPIKGQDVAIDALARLRADGRRVRLALVGGVILGTEGDLVDRLTDRARSLGVAEHVDVVGHLEDPGAWHAAADIAVHGAMHEAFGLSVVEALGHGVPVVATDTDGPRSILGEEHGLLVPPGDVEAMAAAIGRVLDDRDLATRLAADGPARAEAFSPTETARQWDRLLRDALPQHCAPAG